MFKIEIDPQNKKIYVDTPKEKCFKMVEGFRINPVSGIVEYEDGSGAVKAFYYRPEDLIEIVEMSLTRGTNLCSVDAILALRFASGCVAGLKDSKDFYDEFRDSGYRFVASGS